MNKLVLFLGLLISFRMNAEASFLDDSVGLEKKDGKVFILHKVEPKETFYSISKRYSTTVDEIKKYNPEASAGLKIGQTIFVPTKAKISSIPAKNVQVSTPKSNSASSGPVTHNVAPKETLFSISRKYNVTIDELKKENPEIASGLKIGQVITIPGKGKKSESPVAVKEKVVDKVKVAEDKKAEEKKQEEKKIAEEKKKAEEKNEEKKKEEKAAELKEKEAVLAKETKKKEKETDVAGVPVSSTTTVGGYTKVSETGIGELMENGDTQKYLALHKTAPPGTIIQVVNQANNQKIFVKVIGPLVSGSNPNVVIQMTTKAFERLATSSSEKQIKTEISYIKD
jgi:LysM repeat protein